MNIITFAKIIIQGGMCCLQVCKNKNNLMNKCDKPLCDGQEIISLEKKIAELVQGIGRELSVLEQKVMRMLYDSYVHQLSERFMIDEDTALLTHESKNKAGIVELTEDYACVFKSEPIHVQHAKEIAEQFALISGKMYQELFVRGAQPLASLLSLSSSIPENASVQMELKNTIKAIGSYGNTYGVPMIGGSVHFDGSKQQGITTNLLTIGLIDRSMMLSSGCSGTNNLVYLIGANKVEKQVQANAFSGRTLYELICDLHDEGALVAVQSVGKNGTIGACIDMLTDGTHGMKLGVDILIDESGDFQGLLEYVPDKVIVITRKEDHKKIEKACQKWNKQWIQIGNVINERKLSVTYHQKTVADLSISLLSTFNQNIPKTDIHVSQATPNPPITKVSLPEDFNEVAKFMLTCPNLLSQQWIYEQFDSTIGTNNLSTNFISDAPVMQIKGSRHALALAFCNNTYDIQQHPEAVNLVVAESLRKIICSGGTPSALTGCLNYSDSSKEQAEKYLRTVNDHIAMTCKQVGMASSGISINCVPSTSHPIHNISIGSIAFLNDKHQHMTMSFKGKGDMIYMLGKSVDDINSSEYIRTYHDVWDTPPPHINMDDEIKLLRATQKIIARKLVKSAHSVTKGGLFMALLESSMVRSFGFDITVDEEIRKDAFLFGESPSRIIVSVAIARETDFIDFMMETEVPFLTLGHVTREEIRIDDTSYGFISDYKKQYMGAR